MARQFLALGLVGTANAFASCCAFGGSGSAMLVGAGVMTVPPQTTSSGVNMFIGVDAVNERLVVLVNDTTPEFSLAGWTIEGTQSGQTLTFWTNDGANGPNCYSASVSAPDYYAPGYTLCPGVVNSLFPAYTGLSYTDSIHQVAQVGSTGAVQSLLMATDSSAGCVPLSMAGSSTPIGGGAWNMVILNGTAAVPPPEAFVLPSWCKTTE